MYIDYSINNATCANNNGFIIINSIQLEPKEISKYGANYSIEWSNNISLNQISKNNLFVKNLTPDNYSFRIFGNGNFSDWKNLTIDGQSAPQITNLKTIKQCDGTYDIQFQINGGLSPYIISVDNKIFQSDVVDIELQNIPQTATNVVTVQDANGCFCEIKFLENILIPIIQFSLLDQKAPLIYDDKLESIKFAIYHYNIDNYIIHFINKNDNEITCSIRSDESKYIYEVSNNTTYFLLDQLYPGDYDVQVLDDMGCVKHSETIRLFNRSPLSINLNIVDDSAIGTSFNCSLLPILDSLLIPINLIDNDSDVQFFVKNLKTQSNIHLYINNVKYVQTVLDHSIYINNKEYVNLLEFENHKYFYIKISNGINLEKNVSIFTDTIEIDLNGNRKIIFAGISQIQQNISLVRKYLISSSNNRTTLQKSEHINLYNEKQTISATILSNQALYNQYNIGSVSCLSLNIDDNLFKFINEHFDLSCYPTDQTIHTGSIAINVSNYTSENYFIEYFYINPKTQSLNNIYLNNKKLNANRATFLPSGTYIIKLKEKNNNKIIFINGIDYNAHYASAKQQILDSKIPFEFDYGDVLVNIFDINQPLQEYGNIPGIEQEIQLTKQNISNNFTIQSFEEINLASENCHNSLSVIIQPASTPCCITGPNNFNYIIDKQTKFTNIAPGVYNITGSVEYLDKNCLSQTTKTINIGKNSQENITIIFDSYFNKYLIGK